MPYRDDMQKLEVCSMLLRQGVSRVSSPLQVLADPIGSAKLFNLNPTEKIMVGVALTLWSNQRTTTLGDVVKLPPVERQLVSTCFSAVLQSPAAIDFWLANATQSTHSLL